MLEQTTLSSGIIMKKSSKVKCEVCGREFEVITYTHLKTHGITMHKYREQYPDALLVSDGYRKKISKTLTGKEPIHKMIEGYKKRLGRHLTDEHKQHLRDNSPHLSGEKNGMYGKHQTEAAKQLMKDSSPHLSGEDHPMHGKGCLIAGENNGMFGRTGDKHPMYKGGISNLPYCEKFDEDLKERVRDFFNGCCYVCGVGQSELGQKLDVHHVNYNKMVCCNDVKPLFVPLCRSCHSKTLKDREYWEEFFTVSLNYLTNGQCFLPKKCIIEEKGD